MRRLVLLVTPVLAGLVLAGSVVAAAPAGACGGLVGENGTIQLTRTTTLAAFHDGVERYVTSFEFTGEGAEVGSIVPLPGVPTSVERGGDWTLQRLEREVAPPVATATAFDRAAPIGSAEVLLETKIDALDITILRGGGDAVGQWAVEHGFLLTPDAPAVLDHYSHKSKVFMAARFDAGRARDLGQNRGDGTPIMLTIPTEQPWVPLRILALGLDRSQAVDADVFLLTDTPAQLHADPHDLRVVRSEPADRALLTDLRSDKGMGWVPDTMWFTYLQVASRAGKLRGDLAVTARQSWWPGEPGVVVG
ncbi:MAG: DUF2330 domain-containing protein [Acidimicrobiia bacterium]